MAADDKISQLNRELGRQGLGPVGAISNQATAALGSAVGSIANWLRETAYDRPLITLLLSFEAGFLIGRLGRRYARH